MGTRLKSRIYPNKDRVFLDGGLNNNFDRAFIDDNQSPDCQNVIFDDGSVETRGGTDKLNATAVGSYICDGLFTRHDNDGSQTMVAWFNGTAYLNTAATFTTLGSAQSIYTAGERVYAAEYENHIFFGNGNNTPYKYNGTDFTRHGIEVPSAPAVATASTGTALTGDYQYAVSYVNSALVEGDISTITATWTGSTENAALTGIPTAPASYGVASRNIYRTEAGGTQLKRLTTLNDNSTTTYEDAIADGSLGVDSPTDNGGPPNYETVIYHGSRLFVIDPATNLVKYSEIGNPYVFKSSSFLRVGDNTFDIPRGLAVYDNSLVVFCKVNPWIVYMGSTTASEWQVLRVRANLGSNSPAGFFAYDNKVMFPALEKDKIVGFAAIQGQTVSPSASILTSSAVGNDLKSQAIEPDVFLFNEAKTDNIVSQVYKSKAYITVPYGESQTENNRIYVFDFSKGRIKRKNTEPTWVPWTGLSANDFTIFNGNLYYGTSEATGFVYQMNTSTYNDDGAAIDSYYWTKEFSGLNGDQNIQKDFRHTQLFYELAGDYDMDFTVRADSDRGSGNTSQINLNPGGSLWGTMVWGTDNWSAGQDEKESRKYLDTVRGKRIQFKFSNQNVADQKFKVLGMNFVYNNKGFR